MKPTDRIITELLSLLGETKTFLYAQIPDILQQILRWKATENGLQVIASFIGLYVAYRIHLLIQSALQKDKWIGAEALYVVVMFISVPSVIGALCGVSTFLQIILAPKIFLIHYLRDLVR